jgi:hypothetical protein
VKGGEKARFRCQAPIRCALAANRGG